MKIIRLSVFAICLGLLPFALCAQQTSPPPPSSSEAAAQLQQPADEQMTEENMILEGESLYHHGGERDPFSPLIRSNKGIGASVKIHVGTKGISQFTVDQCVLEGVIKVDGEEAAWFQGPNLKPYKAKVGDTFADGVIIDVSYGRGEVIVQQELDDPTAIKPFRNVSLKIRNQSQSQEGEAQ